MRAHIRTNRRDDNTMSKPKKYTAKPVTVEALQFVLGETTKGDILEFCPIANVGVPFSTDIDERNTTDIRWINIAGSEVHDGEWIVKRDAERFVVLTAEEFDDGFDPASRAVVYRDTDGKYRYRVIARNHEIEDASHEGYATAFNAYRALRAKHGDIDVENETDG